MKLARPEFRPDPAASRAEMEDQQRAIAEAASFDDDLGFDPAALAVEDPIDSPGVAGEQDDTPAPGTSDNQDENSNADHPQSSQTREGDSASEPIVAGIDQAFQGEQAVSAVVAVQGGTVIEGVCGRTELSIPYIPGLLAFREGGPIIDALQQLSVDPDLLVFDGSGRIHYRQAGIATHVGVLFDRPAIGVAKNLLCGEPAASMDDPLPAGERIPVLADEEVEAPAGTELGYAFQSRQFPDPSQRHVNPIYVSPGHRVSAELAVDLVAALCAGFKLPEPIRLADRAAEDCKD